MSWPMQEHQGEKANDKHTLELNNSQLSLVCFLQDRCWLIDMEKKAEEEMGSDDSIKVLCDP